MPVETAKPIQAAPVSADLIEILLDDEKLPARKPRNSPPAMIPADPGKVTNDYLKI